MLKYEWYLFAYTGVSDAHPNISRTRVYYDSVYNLYKDVLNLIPFSTSRFFNFNHCILSPYCCRSSERVVVLKSSTSVKVCMSSRKNTQGKKIKKLVSFGAVSFPDC